MVPYTIVSFARLITGMVKEFNTHTCMHSHIHAHVHMYAHTPSIGIERKKWEDLLKYITDGTLGKLWDREELVLG